MKTCHLTRIALCTGFVLAGLLAGANAQTINEILQLEPPGGLPNGCFGQAVGVLQDRAIVGTPGAEAVYLFDADAGSMDFTFSASDGDSGDDFGCSVAFVADWILVGAKDWDGGDNSLGNSGAAYVFGADSPHGQLQRLVASDAAVGDGFGYAVALSGTTALIGAPFDDDQGTDAGSAYLFDLATGAQIHKLVDPDGIAEAKFGVSVAIDGDIAIVGAPGQYDSRIGGNAGGAYLFDVSTGALLRRLEPNGLDTGGRFGAAVAVRGNIAVVGAPDDGGNGRAYIFDVSTGAQSYKCWPGDLVSGANFGAAVAIDRVRAVIGAPGQYGSGGSPPTSTVRGAAYVFNTLTGTQVTKLESWDLQDEDQFGWSVAVNGDRVVVGANTKEVDGVDWRGSAYLFDLTELNGNTAPVAEAGSNQTVTDTGTLGVEDVTLDGSASYDPDGDTLVEYHWTWDGGGSATGTAPTVTMPSGTTWIQLTVMDEHGDIGTNIVSVTVRDLGGGDGTEGDPYKIHNRAHFDIFCANPVYWDDHIQLWADIDLLGTTYDRAPIAPDGDDSKDGFQGDTFSGFFDGNGHVVSNLTIDTAGAGRDYLGLFGKISGAQSGVRRLGVALASIDGGDSSIYLGGLCGANIYGTINECFSSGIVLGGSGSGKLGGLCGWHDTGRITNCFSTATVNGYETLGGLCGFNDGVVGNCYAAGPVDGTSETGGLCGDGSGAVTACFWDTQTSWQEKSAGGTGLSTSDMQTQSTFTDAGWGFYTQGPFNGVDDLWVMNGYPQLSRFGIPVNAAPEADAGSDQSVIDLDDGGSETVTLDGSASSDADGTIESYSWTWSGGSASGAVTSGTFGLGTTVVTLTVTDNRGATDTDSVVITVSSPPEIEIRGNGIAIQDGDGEPDVSDGTDFGTQDIDDGGVVHQFAIWNLGLGDLTLTGNVAVALSDDTHFSISTQPSSPVAPETATTLAVTFDPVTTGSHEAVVTVLNNDLDEGVYTFTIGGAAVNLSSIGDRVWFDADGNGVQNAGEAGVPDITVSLLDASGIPTGVTDTTDGNGNYLFEDLLAGDYIVEFADLPANRCFTLSDVGSDTVDSDADPSSGRSAIVTVVPGQHLTDVDAGITTPRMAFYAAGGHTGAAAWDTDGTGPEPQKTGHSVFGTTAYYYMASREYDDIDPDSSGLFYGEGTLLGLTNFAQALADSGLTLSDITMDFGLLSLGEDLYGEDWWIEDSIEHRYYERTEPAGTLTIYADGLPMLSARLPTFYMKINYSDLQIDGSFGPAAMFDASAGQPPAITNAAAALLADLGPTNGLRFVVGSAYEQELFSGNGRSGKFYVGATGSCYMERTPLPHTGRIDGLVWADEDGDGVRDGDELPLTGVTVYLDMNDNGTHDAGEPGTASGADGTYSFLDLLPADYRIRQQTPSGYMATCPVDEAYLVYLTMGQAVDNVNFGNQMTFPEVEIRGGSPAVVIASGDATPATVDGTDFGDACFTESTVVHTFTIHNSGDGDLELAGGTTVDISGDPLFAVIAEPDTLVPPGGMTTFEIGFDPSVPGAHTAVVSVANNDTDENPYTFTVAGVSSADLYVDDTATGLDNGSSWDNAFPNLQTAIGTAVSGSVVRVAAGIYKPGSSRNSHFGLKSHVTMLGGYPDGGGLEAERDPSCLDNEAILSGEIWDLLDRTDNCYNVIAVTAQHEADGVMLDGFVITRGYANGSDHESRGGGMYMYQNNTPTIRNCTFRENYAVGNGGGLYTDSPIVLTGCAFEDNESGGSGGGADLGYGKVASVEDCTFTGNLAGGNGGGLVHGGTGSTGPRRCTFTRNSAMGDGGAAAGAGHLVDCVLDSNSAMDDGGAVENMSATRCVFVNNTADSEGGAVYTHDDDSHVFLNCVFTGNSAQNGGVAVIGPFADTRFRNCTMVDNQAVTGRGNAITYRDSSPTIVNCILWDGGSEIYGGSPVVSCSCVQGGVSGTGNINSAPLFMDAMGGDLRLRYGSPCIDAGSNTIYTLPDTDLDGNARKVNDTVDMGAYEYDASLYDSDGDTLTDAFELANGTSPVELDTDSDGQSDYEEYVADTDGSDSNSFFRILSLEGDTVGFSSSASRRYALYGATTVTGEWTQLGEKIGDGLPNDTLQGRPADVRFYRLDVSLP